MNWFDNIKIRNKLLIVFGMLVFGIFAFGAFTVVEITNIGKTNNEMVYSSQARHIYIADAIVEVYQMRYANLSRGYLLEMETEGAAHMVAKILEDFEKSVVAFRKNMTHFCEAVESDPRLTESEKRQRLTIAGGIEDTFAQYEGSAGKIMSAVEGLNRQQMIRTFEEAIIIGNDLNEKLQNLRDLSFFTARRKALDAEANTVHTINLILFISAILVVLSAFALVFTIRNINQPISNLEEAVLEITQGNLAFPIRSERKDELGTLSNYIGDMVDKISEQSKTMAIMDNLDSMICVSDLDYNLLYVNKRLTDRFGIDKDIAVTQKCYKATRNKEEPCSFCQLSELFPYKDVFPSKDFEYIWDDTLNVWLGGTASIIRWVDGKMVLFQASRDVTQKRRQRDLLQEALQEAQTASVAKSAFLANMSHEIRTPMNAILGISEIQLQDETLKPETQDALNKIYNSGSLLLNIINDILDLSKIEAGKLELAPAEYKIASLINDTMTLNMMRIGSKPIKFMLSVNEATPETLYGDELRIKQILNNVISNAIKYTKEGEVWLKVHVEGGSGDVTLVFTVSDTGLGMTPEQVSRLFDEYSRFNIEANRTTEGTGLGMSITRNLIQMMNGRISVKSEVGKGSVFTIRLPQGDTGSAALGRELAASLEKFETSGVKQMKRAQIAFEPMPYGSILVVDDVESNLYVAKGLMTPYGLSVETVTSGFDALARIKDGKVYDIVFMDHMMPEMDGIETTKKIREAGYTQTVVALTANAVVGQSDVFLANGFDGFISKPIDVRQLNAILKKFVRDKQPPEVIAAAQRKKQEKEAAGGAAQPAAPAVDPELAEIFVRDARKAIATLEEILKKREAYGEDDIRLYTINVHAMKSALANIGEPELSAAALKLEQAGREKNTTLMSSETPGFLGELGKIIEKLTPKNDAGGGPAGGDMNDPRAYLREKLLIVKTACGTFDKKTAKEALSELREKAWPRATKELLSAMSEHLLNGDFEEVSRAAEKLTGK